MVFRGGLTSAAHSVVFPEPYLPLPQWRRSWSAVSVRESAKTGHGSQPTGGLPAVKGRRSGQCALRPPQGSLQSRAGGEGARGPWGGGAEKSLLGFSATLFYPILATRSAGLLPVTLPAIPTEPLGPPLPGILPPRQSVF